METIFRLPWSTASIDPPQKQRAKPRVQVDISILKDAKRKRMDSLDASPKNALLPKKLKCEQDGLVRQGSHVRPSTIAMTMPYKAIEMDVKPVAASTILKDALGEDALETNALGKENISSSVENTVSRCPDSILPTPNADCSVKIEAANKVEATPLPVMASPESNVDKVRAIIEAQINMEILHNHNELRLIEQELAKCQISLEQLRRCELMPYPGATGPSQEVTRGLGKALKTPSGYKEPQHPAPWGVTDGPYARHYAKWLIPDASFDPLPVHQQYHVGTPMTTRGNRVRGNAFDFVLPAPPQRASRVSSGHRDHNGSTSGRDPMIMKRQQDNTWVRLRCSVCLRTNFNNIQGFLNHCRIAHHQDYKSHEAAAIACGEAITPEEANAAAAADTTPAAKEAIPPPRTMSMPLPPLPSAMPTPTSALPTMTPIEQPHVNPLTLQTPMHRPLERVLDLTSAASPKPAIARSSMSGAPKSQVAPNLSTLMERRGLPTTELSSFIAEAKKKVDLSAYDVSDSEDDKENKAKKQKKKAKSGSRQHSTVSTPTVASARPLSSKGFMARQAPTFAVAPPATGIGFHPSVFQHTPDTPSDGDIEMGLSPGTAPGLMSDHEDDFDEVDEAHSANGSTTDVVMEDIEIASDEERDGERKRMSLGGDERQVCRANNAQIV